MEKLRNDMEDKLRHLINTQQRSADSEDEPIVLDEKHISTKVGENKYIVFTIHPTKKSKYVLLAETYTREIINCHFVYVQLFQ